MLLIRVEAVEMHWDALHGADAIVFGSPTYMGSVSAKMNVFMRNRLGSFAGAMAQSNADEGPDVAPPRARWRDGRAL